MLSRQLETSGLNNQTFQSPKSKSPHILQIPSLYIAPEAASQSYLAPPPGFGPIEPKKKVIPQFDQVIQVAKNRSYRIERKLGEGAFGTVLKAYSYEDDCYYAMKEQKRSTANKAKMIDREIHNNLLLASCLPETELSVLFVECFDYQDACYMVMEKMDIDLYMFLERLKGRSLNLKYVKILAHQILSAVVELHEVGLAHCDLKLENVMFVDRKGKEAWKTKLIDFGFLKDISALDELQGKQFGTKNYWSPEMFLGLPLSEKTDLWAIGIMFIELLSGQRMFFTDEKDSIFGNIVHIFGTPDDMQQGVHYEEFFDSESEESESLKWRNSVRIYHEDCWYPYRGLDNLFEFVNNIDEDFDDYCMTNDDFMFKDLLEKLLKPNADERISAREALNHPFFK